MMKCYQGAWNSWNICKEVSVLGSNAKFVDNSKITSVPLKYPEVRGPFCVTTAYSSDCYVCSYITKFVLGYDETFRRCQDYELWLKLCHHSFKLENRNQVTTIINVREK